MGRTTIAAGVRIAGWLVGASAALAAWAPLASAATVAHDPLVSGTARYSAGTNESNLLAVKVDGGSLLFEESPTVTVASEDTGVGMADVHCIASTSGASASCPATGIDRVAIDLGNLDDTVTLGAGVPAATIHAGEGDDILIDRLATTGTVNELFGEEGNDAIIGGPGVDTLNGGAGADSFSAGAGDDTIFAADGVAEAVNCGDGNDTATLDRGANGVIDIQIDCETVSGPEAPLAASSSSSPPAGPTPPPVLGSAASVTTDNGTAGTAPAASLPAPRDLTPPVASLRLAARMRLVPALARGVFVPVRCGESCGISITLALDRPAARRLGLAPSAGPAIVGTASARATGAGAQRVRVALTKRARKALRRTRRVTLTVQVLVSDANGNGTLLQRRLTLVRPLAR